MSSADLLIEVRCEELPVSMIGPALDGLESGLLALLKGVEHGAARAFSTPRRLCVVVEGVAGARPVEDRYVHGPNLSVAKKDGAWTGAALGFAKKNGVGVEALVEIDGPKGDRVIAARFSAGGETTPALIAGGLEALILGLPFKKSMRWGSGAARWGRPFHQVIAVYGGARIDATVAGIPTTDAVIGHRLSTLAPGPVANAETYLAALRDRHVLADRAERRAVIREGLAAVAAGRGVEVALNEALIDEVTDLVEWPVPLAATFAEELLHLPPRLLVESMRVNQRVFPTLRDGQLTNVILTVSNNPFGDAALIAEGNKRVLAARFYDAQFFYAEDRKTPLAQHGEGLVKMRWVKGLGTMADKQERIGTLAQSLASLLGADPLVAFQAGSLAKADLLTLMVGEFPELQGHMGRLYAQNDGLDAKVALAIEEHYLPRFAADGPPTSAAGQTVGLADRLDTLAGCFGIGLVPKGSADPQGPAPGGERCAGDPLRLGPRRAAHGLGRRRPRRLRGPRGQRRRHPPRPRRGDGPGDAVHPGAPARPAQGRGLRHGARRRRAQRGRRRGARPARPGGRLGHLGPLRRLRGAGAAREARAEHLQRPRQRRV
ncbi:MAG: glycine--tRNA ligase subunit beta [Deltaproteobacteria bacterium]|nr:glycine--tRNA ligase subunit beta [Deltaproteobacteria bacterium]